MQNITRGTLIELLCKESKIPARLFLLIMREFQHKDKVPDPFLEYVQNRPPRNFLDMFDAKINEETFQESVVDFDLVLKIHRIINNLRICYECGEKRFHEEYLTMHSSRLLDKLCKDDPTKRQKVEEEFFSDLFDANMEGFIFHALYFTLGGKEESGRKNWIQLSNIKSFTPLHSKHSKLEVRNNFWWLEFKYSYKYLGTFNTNPLIHLRKETGFDWGLYQPCRSSFGYNVEKVDDYKSHCIESILINHKRLRDDISITYIENMEKIRTHKFKECDRKILLIVSFDPKEPNKRTYAGAYIENKTIIIWHNMLSTHAIKEVFEEYKDHDIDQKKVKDIESVLGFLEYHVVEPKPKDPNYKEIGSDFMKIVYSHPKLPVYTDKFTTHHKNLTLKRFFSMFAS